VDLISRLEGAVRSNGSFVHFTVGVVLTGLVFMSVFVSAASRIAISVEGAPNEEIAHVTQHENGDWDYL
jgi:hypothetical protein